MNLPREQLNTLVELMAAEFAAFELHLFLDTHPDDPQALAAHQAACARADALQAEYERRYSPLTPCGSSSQAMEWEWINPPWPWEICY